MNHISCFYTVTIVLFCALNLRGMQDPIAHWNFNEGQNGVAHDLIGNDDADLIGSVGWQLGESGFSVDMAGGSGDFVQIGSDNRSPVIPEGSDFTISVWINPISYSSRQAVYGHHSGNSLSYAAYWLEISNGRPAVGLGNGTTYKFFSNLNGSHPLTDGEWVHWTVVRQGNELISYINGEHAVTKTINFSGTFPKHGTVGTRREMIGASYHGNSHNFEGRIDELKIWDEALAGSAVQKIYVDAFAHWEFEQVVGSNTLLDSNGDNDGTIHGLVALDSGQPGDAVLNPGSAGDFVQIGSDNRSPVIPEGSDFSISVWINPTSYSSRQAVYGHHSGNSLNYAAYWLEISNGRPAVGLGNGTTYKFFSNLNGSHPLTDGEWVHWTVVRQGNELISYINGEHAVTKTIDFSGTFPKHGTVGTRREMIGASYHGNSHNFEGRIDDLRVWHKPLSQESVSEVFYDSMIDVREWGALGDGVTDDATSINQALSASSGDSKFVLLDEGVFLTNSPVTLLANTKLYGRNAILRNGTRQKVNENAPMLNIQSDCELHDLIIDGNALGVDGVRIVNGTNILIENCAIENIDRNTAGVFGLVIRQTVLPSHDIVLKSCTFDNIQYSGNALGTSASCRGVMIVSNLGHAMSNVEIDQCTFSNIRSNNEHFDGDCIQILVDEASDYPQGETPPWDFVVTNCEFTEFSKRGIKAHSDRVYAANNHFYDPNLDISWGTAISFFGNDCLAENNDIDLESETNANGLMIGGNDNRILDNKILLSDQPQLTGRSSGVYMGSSHESTGNQIQGNYVRGGLYGLIVLNAGDDNNVFTDNILDVTDQTYHNPYSASNTTSPNTLPWDSTQLYLVGDRVHYLDSVYECDASHTNKAPSSGSGYWEFIETIDW